MKLSFDNVETDSVEVGAWRTVPRHLLSGESYVHDLTLRNPAYISAVSQGRETDADPFVRLYEEDGGIVRFPRHYKPKLRQACPEIRTFSPNATPKRWPAGLSPLLATATPRNERQVEAVEWLAKGIDGRLMERAGSGKCSKMDTMIILNGVPIRMDEAWERWAGPATYDGKGWWATPTKPLWVYALSAEGQLHQRQVRRLYRQEVSEPLRTYEMDDGSSCTVTAAHKLYTGAGTWTNEVSPGDRLCVPALLPTKAETTSPVPAFVMRTCAFILAEGYEYSGGSSPTVRVQTKNAADLHALVADWKETTTYLGIPSGRCNVLPARNRNMFAVGLPGTRWAEWVEDVAGGKFGRRAANKRVYPLLMQSDDDDVREFLRTYFDRDGGVEGQNSITVTTASEGMRYDLDVLLRRLGVWARWARKMKRATNGTGPARPYWQGTISGLALRVFATEVGFRRDHHVRRLDVILAKSTNTNVETIPVSDALLDLHNRFNLSLPSMGLPKSYRPRRLRSGRQPTRSALQDVPRMLRSIANNTKTWNVSRKSTQKYLAHVHKMTNLSPGDIDVLRRTADYVERMMTEQVQYATVRTITEEQYDGYVYDFEVDTDHNYVANGVLMHNTVVSLIAAARVGILPILVIVHEQGTMEQWVDRIAEHTAVPAGGVGVVQGQRQDYRGRPITVAMMHTLALGELRDPHRWDDLKDWMHGGLVIYDEVDVYAPTKMKTGLAMFEATRWGLTATHRHDGLQKVIDLHLGTREFYRGGYELDPLVVSCRVAVPEYTTKFRQSKSLSGHLETKNTAYRRALQNLCRESLDDGRKTMLLLERVEAVESFGTWGREQGYEVGVIHGKIPKRARLDELAKQFVVANRRIAGRALDAPDLSTVIVASPTSNPALSEQIAGRCLRTSEGKKRPVVIICYPNVQGKRGQALSILAKVNSKHIRSLRSCGFNEIRYEER